MSAHADSNASALKQLWTRIARFIEAFEDPGDPVLDYTRSLGKRVEKLEHAVEDLERQLQSREGSRIEP